MREKWMPYIYLLKFLSLVPWGSFTRMRRKPWRLGSTRSPWSNPIDRRFTWPCVHIYPEKHWRYTLLLNSPCLSLLVVYSPPPQNRPSDFRYVSQKVPTERFPLFFSMSLQMVLSELFVAFWASLRNSAAGTSRCCSEPPLSACCHCAEIAVFRQAALQSLILRWIWAWVSPSR